jgi:hypothetical protein
MNLYFGLFVGSVVVGGISYVIARLSYLFGYHRGWIHGAIHVSNQIMAQQSENGDDIEGEEEKEARPH